jgi:hypothetical protein
MPEPHKAAGSLDQPGRLGGFLGGIGVNARLSRRPSHQTQITGHVGRGQQQELLRIRRQAAHPAPLAVL